MRKIEKIVIFSDWLENPILQRYRPRICHEYTNYYIPVYNGVEIRVFVFLPFVDGNPKL